MNMHATLDGVQPPSSRKVFARDTVGSDRALVAIGQCMAVYYGVAILIHFFIPRFMGVTSVQANKQRGKDTIRDALRSIVPLLIKGLTLFAAEFLHSKNIGRLTDESLVEVISNPRGLLEIACSILLLDLFHDTWFYFMHRVLHSSWMLRHVHYMHHQSCTPSAFTGYSFHWLEAIMVFSVGVAECFIFPIPLALHRIYELWMVAIHVAGHCGYEMAPFVPHVAQVLGLMGTALYKGSGFKGGRLTSVINNVEHHDMHHRYPKYHFSLYFTHWDRICGTMHPEYTTRHGWYS